MAAIDPKFCMEAIINGPEKSAEGAEETCLLGHGVGTEIISELAPWRRQAL